MLDSRLPAALMRYYLNLFSPATWEAFCRSSRDVSGFQPRHRKLAARVQPGDRLVCYMTKLSRWCGVFEVLDGPFEDETPIFYPDADPFVVRFHVRPRICLDVEKAVPIKERALWAHLTFTAGYQTGSSAWAQKVKGSLTALTEADGALIESVLQIQAAGGTAYPVDQEAYRRLTRHVVRRVDGAVAVSVPDAEPEPTEAPELSPPREQARESIRVQALLADLGTRLGLQVWIPKADRQAVLAEWKAEGAALLDRLPLNYDDVTLQTIERIDVLWLKGRSIRHAFEVEHTTSIYSGLLRMADLLALQPNMDIQLHIVAPDIRREKVFEEMTRPVFSLLERGPLANSCTFIAYSSVRDLLQQPNLEYMTDRILEQFEEEAE